MKSIQIVAPDNGVGLTRSRNLLYSLLTEAGYDVDLTNSMHHIQEYRNKRYNLNLIVEVINPRYFNNAPKNIGIFHPDWYAAQWRRYAGKFSAAFCITQHAMPIFKSIGYPRADYVGFTSGDKNQEVPFSEKNKTDLLHLPGRSALKNTRKLIQVWNTFENLPKLVIVNHGRDYSPLIKTDNIDYELRKMPEEEYNQVLNKYLFHVMPSICEGFGHAINESRSTGAIVITTNGQPMNEMINNHNGILIAANKVQPHNYAPAYVFLQHDLVNKVRSLAQMEERRLEVMSNNARRDYLNLDTYFKNTFVKTLEKYI